MTSLINDILLGKIVLDERFPKYSIEDIEKCYGLQANTNSKQKQGKGNKNVSELKDQTKVSRKKSRKKTVVQQKTNKVSKAKSLKKICVEGSSKKPVIPHTNSKVSKAKSQKKVCVEGSSNKPGVQQTNSKVSKAKSQKKICVEGSQNKSVVQQTNSKVSRTNSQKKIYVNGSPNKSVVQQTNSKGLSRKKSTNTNPKSLKYLKECTVKMETYLKEKAESSDYYANQATKKTNLSLLLSTSDDSLTIKTPKRKINLSETITPRTRLLDNWRTNITETDAITTPNSKASSIVKSRRSNLNLLHHYINILPKKKGKKNVVKVKSEALPKRKKKIIQLPDVINDMESEDPNESNDNYFY